MLPHLEPLVASVIADAIKMNPIACTTFTYTKEQVQSLAICFKHNNFRIDPAISWGLEVFKTEDVGQILCIAGLLDKIKAVADGNPITDKDVTSWIQEALDKTK